MRTPIVLATVFLISACATSPAPLRESMEIVSRRQAFVEAFNRSDVPALKQFYAPDAILLAFTGQAVTSVGMIATGLGRASSIFNLTLEPIRSRSSGGLLYEVGRWRHTDKKSGEARDHGTYSWIWRKDASGQWVIEVHSVTRQER